MMSEVQSTEGREILDKIGRILLENETLRSVNKDLVTRNVQLSSTVADLTINSHVNAAQADESGGQGRDLLVPPGDATGPYFPLSLPDIAPRRFKTFANTMTETFDTVLSTNFPSDLVWVDFYTKGFYFMHTHKITKNGTIKPVRHKNSEKLLELLLQIDGQLCYIGSFRSTICSTLSPHNFQELSESTKKRIIKLSATKKVLRKLDVASKFASGQMGAVRVELQQVGFDRKVCQCLMVAADILCWSRGLADSSRNSQEGVDESDEEDDQPLV